MAAVVAVAAVAMVAARTERLDLFRSVVLSFLYLRFYVFHHHFSIHFPAIPLYHDSTTRAQALTLKAVGLTDAQIEEVTGIPSRTLNNLLDKAAKAGFELLDANGRLGRICNAYIDNALKAGRPGKGEFTEEVLQKVRQNRSGREKLYTQIVMELEGKVSAITVWRILRKSGMKKTKPTRKPGLTKEIRA